MPSVGPLEIVIVAMIALIVFGPEKLPEIARTIGRATSEMRRMADEVRSEFQNALEEDEEARRKDGSGPADEPAGDEEPGDDLAATSGDGDLGPVEDEVEVPPVAAGLEGSGDGLAGLAEEGLAEQAPAEPSEEPSPSEEDAPTEDVGGDATRPGREDPS